MDKFFSRILDRISDTIANHRGMPILICLPMVIFNYILRVIPGTQLGFVETTDLFLHLAVFIGLLGVLLGEAL
ncbi:MAG TPA: hypothetical protein VFF70_13480 [Anaerolineae bacterium]|jgi:hypothetical protein|nr:hypothetical protein [Anaerolineae bacterium]